MLKDYYIITKPGIIYGNIITAVAGFLFASYGDIQYGLLVMTVLGLSCVIAGGCVFNNYIDRDIDGVMERTKDRPSVHGRIPPTHTLIYASILSIVGLGILRAFTNTPAFIAALVGLFVYVVIYSLWLKRTSSHSTLIGSISGATPILVGYLAVQGIFDTGAVLLFLVMAIWQMPHFFAIAIYRFEDYKAANIPVLPVKKGIQKTKTQIFLYLVLFLLVTLLVTVLGYAGKPYFVVMSFVGLAWIGLSLQGFSAHKHEEKVWAKKMFFSSIIALLLFCLTLVVDHFV